MDRPPAPAALRVQWEVPGDGTYADLLAAVGARQQRRVGSASVRPWILWATFLLVVPVLVVATWPGGLLFGIFAVTFFVLLKFGVPRSLAKSVRNQPTAGDHYTVTLDRDGYHVVSPNVADHLRWTVFESAVVDEDVLVLQARGVKHIRLTPMVTLDPAVDRTALVAELNRLIEADAPPAVGSTA